MNNCIQNRERKFCLFLENEILTIGCVGKCHMKMWDNNIMRNIGLMKTRYPVHVSMIFPYENMPNERLFFRYFQHQFLTPTNTMFFTYNQNHHISRNFREIVSAVKCSLGYPLLLHIVGLAPGR